MTLSTSAVAVCCCSDSQFVEQVGIFNRDRGLVGKGPDQGDLLLGEGLHLATPYADDAD